MTTPGRGHAPRRVRITSPRQTASRAHRGSRYRDLEEETALGEVYLDSILRTQRRLTFSLVICVALMVLLLPGLLLLAPEVVPVGGVGVPASWVGLGVLVYPAAVLLTYWYVRAAERVESEFGELMDLP
ncbi:hypothetical protein [Mobilicoccus massiliensis]|uniref:hypothetical protein n=1 Tax=Mobilicoccus massiliensis TaxID=1522310 RepID=UPI00059135D1|nr:hypothetical protein [Mobilicoccus massiliensis]